MIGGALGKIKFPPCLAAASDNSELRQHGVKTWNSSPRQRGPDKRLWVVQLEATLCFRFTVSSIRLHYRAASIVLAVKAISYIRTNKIKPFRYRLSDSTNSTMHRSGGLWGFAALRLHGSARLWEHNASWRSMGWWSLASATQGRQNNPGWGTRAEKKKSYDPDLITTLCLL